MLRFVVAAAAIALTASAASAQPTDVAVTASDGTLTVSWTAAGDVNYNLYVATEPGVTVANIGLLEGGRVYETVGTPFTLGGLDNNRPYFLIVGEVGSNGVILESDEVVGVPRGAWEQALGGTVIAAVAADPEAPGVYLAGGAGEGAGCGGAAKVPGCDIFRSNDSGVTWTPVTGGINQIDIRAVDIRGGLGFAVSLSVDGGTEKIFATTNGIDWASVQNGTPQGEGFKTIHIDPNNTQVAYAGNLDIGQVAGGMSRILKTTTGGAAWGGLNQITGGELNARTIKVRPGDEQVVWLGGAGTPPLAISSNAGASFIARDAGVTTVLDIELNPDNPDDMWLAGSTAQGPTVLFSSNGGANFEARAAGLPPGTIRDLAFDPAAGLLAAATSQGVYGSSDFGASWVRLGAGLDLPVTRLAYGPSQVLVAATGDGVFRLDLAPPSGVDPTPDAGVDAGSVAPGDSGCCQTSGGAGSTAALALLVLVTTARRRRPRRAGRTPAG